MQLGSMAIVNDMSRFACHYALFYTERLCVTTGQRGRAKAAAVAHPVSEAVLVAMRYSGTAHSKRSQEPKARARNHTAQPSVVMLRLGCWSS